MKPSASFIAQNAVFGLAALNVLWFTAAHAWAADLSAASSMRKGCWPQLQYDAHRSGYSPEIPEPEDMPVRGVDAVKPPYDGKRDALWIKYMPERVSAFVQAIIYDNKVFVGTKSGNLYANDAKTGAFVWKAEGDGPIVHTAAADGGRVFFGCVGGGASLHAVNAADGKPLWKVGMHKGTATAPLLAEGKVYAAGCDGTVYCIAPETGKILWSVELEVPILNSPCYGEGKIFAAAEDMRVYALDAGSGSRAWASDQLYGISFKGYWPVYHKGKIVIRSMPVETPETYYDLNMLMPEPWRGFWGENHTLALERFKASAKGRLPEEEIAMQDILVKHLAEHPYERDMFVLDAASGKEPYVVPSWYVYAMTGPVCPPAVDRDGFLIVPVRYLQLNWGRLDVDVGRVIEVFIDLNTPTGGNPDETFNVSCCGPYVMPWHINGGGAAFTGTFNIDTRSWAVKHHTRSVWHTPPQWADGRPMLESPKIWGGGIPHNLMASGNPPSVADGIIYHIQHSELLGHRITKGTE